MAAGTLMLPFFLGSRRHFWPPDPASRPILSGL